MASSTFWTEQQSAIQAQLDQVRAAISAILVGGVESYMIDNGQSRQQVTKQNIGNLRALETQYLSQLKAIDNYCNPSKAQVGVGF
jgi:hypothetical protein